MTFWLVAASAVASSPVSLQVTDPFPPLGGTIELAMAGGNAGDAWAVAGSPNPAENPIGADTLFLSGAKLLASGTLDVNGEGLAVLNVPQAASFDGRVFHIQARLGSGPTARFTNALSVRLGAKPAFRRSEAVAATPDGSKVYVAHQDGTISVVDGVTDTLLYDRAWAPPPGVGGMPVRAAVDPEGRHLFVIDPQVRTIGVFHTGCDSVVAQIPVPGTSRGIAFDFTGTPLIYVTNDRDNAVLAFRENPPGTFALLGSIPLEGAGPGPLAVLPDGRLVVGMRGTHELEIVDPVTRQTDDRIPLAAFPHDVLLNGTTALVPTFDISFPNEGSNRVFRVDIPSGTITGKLLAEVGTDYIDLAWNGSRLGVVGAGSGSAVITNPSFVVQDVVDLAPGAPVATPTDAVFAGDKLYVVNTFRETVVVVDTSGPPPYPLVEEVAFNWSGAPLRPLGDLTPEADGDWFFRSVQLFNGGPSNPNPQTCVTCHPFGGSDGLLRPSGRQVLPVYEVGSTAPYGSFGAEPSLTATISAAMDAHNDLGLPHFPGGAQLVEAYLQNANPAPESPFLNADGSLPAGAAAGKVLFDGVADCARCHTAPLFIPGPPEPLTIPGGVGTGLVPANVPTLLGVWETPPYLSHGGAAAIEDVMVLNVGDQHGITSGLTPTQIGQIADYVRTL